MSNANTATVSGAPLHSSAAQQRGTPSTVSAQQMGDLLRRYPALNDGEKLELINFIKHGHPDTLAMVTYGSGLVPQVRQLKKAHPDHFPAGWRTLLPWFGFLLIVLLLIALARML